MRAREREREKERERERERDRERERENYHEVKGGIPWQSRAQVQSLFAAKNKKKKGNKAKQQIKLKNTTSTFLTS